jgi:hypothetical protein
VSIRGSAALVLALAVGCFGPLAAPSAGPRTLAEAAKAAGTPERRASIRIVERANDALHRGEVGMAQVLAERALRVDGRNPYAYLLLGQATASDDGPGDALRHLEQAEVLFEAEEPGARLFRARGLLAQAELFEGRGDFERADARRAQARELLEGPRW